MKKYNFAFLPFILVLVCIFSPFTVLAADSSDTYPIVLDCYVNNYGGACGRSIKYSYYYYNSSTLSYTNYSSSIFTNAPFVRDNTTTNPTYFYEFGSPNTYFNSIPKNYFSYRMSADKKYEFVFTFDTKSKSSSSYFVDKDIYYKYISLSGVIGASPEVTEVVEWEYGDTGLFKNVNVGVISKESSTGYIYKVIVDLEPRIDLLGFRFEFKAQETSCGSTEATCNDDTITIGKSTAGITSFEHYYPIFQIGYTAGYSPDVQFNPTEVESFDLLTTKIVGSLTPEDPDDPNDNTDVINKLDDINKTQQETNDKLDNIKDTLTSNDPPDLSSLENAAGWLPAGPIDSILNLPLSFLQNITVNLSKSCQPVILPLPYVNKNLELPCLNTIYAKIGNLSTWINGVGIIASAFILFQYFINLYKWVDDTLTFRENNWLDNWGGI